MPLNSPEEAALRHIYSFYQSVFRLGHYRKAFSQILHCLMMVAVDIYPVFSEALMKR